MEVPVHAAARGPASAAATLPRTQLVVSVRVDLRGMTCELSAKAASAPPASMAPAARVEQRLHGTVVRGGAGRGVALDQAVLFAQPARVECEAVVDGTPQRVRVAVARQDVH